MSYLFDASGEYLAGTFTTGYGDAFTIAAWVKKTDTQWGTGQNTFAFLGDVASQRAESIQLGSNRTVADQIFGACYDTADSGTFANYVFTTDDYNDEWVIVVGTFGINTNWNDSRYSFIENSTNVSSESTTERLCSNTLKILTIGNNSARASLHADALIAEVCMWNKILSAAEIDALQTVTGASAAGPAPNTVANANVVGYWPLDTNGGTGLQNAGSDASGDLTATGATYSSDHPTIVKITSVSTDDVIGTTEDDWQILGSGFGAD